MQIAVRHIIFVQIFDTFLSEFTHKEVCFFSALKGESVLNKGVE